MIQSLQRAVRAWSFVAGLVVVLLSAGCAGSAPQHAAPLQATDTVGTLKSKDGTVSIQMPSDWIVVDPGTESAEQIAATMAKDNPHRAAEFAQRTAGVLLQAVSGFDAKARVQVKDAVTIKRFESKGATRFTDQQVQAVKNSYAKNQNLERPVIITRVDLEPGSSLRCDVRPRFRSPAGKMVTVPTIDFIVPHHDAVYTVSFSTGPERAQTMALIADAAIKTFKLKD